MNPRNDRKFLFDNNNFDLPDSTPEPEAYVEPPPIFTLEELGFARDDAFAKGQAAGLEEARNSREQYLAEQTEHIAQELKFLLGAEEYRAAVYEREVLALTETIFKSLFPHFTAQGGLEEVKAVISKVLTNQPEQSSIVIELPEEDIEAIEAYFRDQGLDADRVIFKPASISKGSCRLSWKDGGALRDHQIIADEIMKILQPNLPQKPVMAEEEPAPLAKEAEKDETETDSHLPSIGD